MVGPGKGVLKRSVLEKSSSSHDDQTTKSPSPHQIDYEEEEDEVEEHEGSTGTLH